MLIAGLLISRDGKKKSVEVEAYIRKSTGYLWLRGGPTGYESMPADRVHETVERGWCACVGGGGYSRLDIPGSSMRLIQESIENGTILMEE